MHMQRERESERASRGLWSSAEIIVLFYDADLKIKLPTDPLLCGRARLLLLLPLIRRWCGLVYGSCGYKWRYGNQRQRWRRDIHDDDGPRGWVLISCVTMLRVGLTHVPLWRVHYIKLIIFYESFCVQLRWISFIYSFIDQPRCNL